MIHVRVDRGRNIRSVMERNMAFYRVVVDKIGIYEAVDRDCPKTDPRREKKPDGSWLPKAGPRFPGAISYWTEFGWKTYRESGLYDWHRSVVKGMVQVIELDHEPELVLYRDEFQIISPRPDLHESVNK